MPELNSPHELKKLRENIISKRDPDRVCVTVCSGTGCLAYRSQDIFAAFEREKSHNRNCSIWWICAVPDAMVFVNVGP